MKKVLLSGMIVGVFLISIVTYGIASEVFKISSDKSTLDEKAFREHEYLGYSPLFRTFSYEKDFELIEDETLTKILQFEFKPELSDIYQEIGILNEKQSVVVVIPIFTLSAYWEPAFYTYYRGECDTSCLTTQIEYTKSLGYSDSDIAVKVLKLLGYPTISDIDIDRDPNILKNYEKLILLHSEYVTKKEFDAITNHPKVVYLYPNALFAEISVNYDDNTITLIRGHGYPEENISNGFDWEFDNTRPYEFDNKCENWQFYEIKNGIMLNCYPENVIYEDKEMLKTIKDY